MTDEQEYLEERAAILEYEAGLKRSDAEWIAAEGFRLKRERETGVEGAHHLREAALAFLRSSDRERSGLGVRNDVDLMAKLAGKQEAA